jgi:L,D-transpeptidase catalytic domain
VLAAVHARIAPSAAARTATTLLPTTPEGTTNIVLVLGESRRGGSLWAHVRLPILPNEQTGWVPRRALGGFGFVTTHLVVDLGRLRATLLSNGRPVFDAPIGAGAPSSPTPTGEFYIREQLSGFGDPFYGPIAFGTSARSKTLTDWPGGGFVGIHGTNAPELIPGYVSHGCIRLRNSDIRRLARLMPVATPVTIR